MACFSSISPIWAPKTIHLAQYVISLLDLPLNSCQGASASGYSLAGVQFEESTCAFHLACLCYLLT